MKFSPRQYAVSLYETFEESPPEEKDKIYKSFINLLVRNNDLGLSSKIGQELEDYTRDKRNQVLVEVKTAVPLETNQKEKLIQSLKEYTKKNIELEQEVDSDILGGAVLKIKDLLIDGSTKTRLKNLKKQLIS